MDVVVVVVHVVVVFACGSNTYIVVCSILHGCCMHVMVAVA